MRQSRAKKKKLRVVFLRGIATGEYALAMTGSREFSFCGILEVEKIFQIISINIKIESV